MPVSPKFVLEQGPVLAGLGRTALSAIKQQLHGPPTGTPIVPGPELTATLAPPSKDLIRTYVRHVGGDPRAYKGVIPPHLFPQWTFGLVSQTLEGVPYPLAKAVNGGCSLVCNAPIPAGEPLTVSVQLANIDDNGRRAVMEQRIVTGTAAVPNAIEARMYAIVPLPKKPGASSGGRRERPRVPNDAREVAFWKLRPDAGLDFAKLTGDFNPIHWIPPAARASGFRNVILHGFSTMARAWEGLVRHKLAGGRRIVEWDVRFTRPLVLPARVGLYTAPDTDDRDHVYVGDAPGGPAYMVGTYRTAELHS